MKKFMLLVLIMLILLGAYGALIKFGLVQAPAFLPDIPFLQNKNSSEKNLTELEKMEKENDILKRQLSSKEKEIETLQKDFQELENKQQALKKADAEYQDKIISLNNQLSGTGTTAAGKESIYKDMAAYFTEMNSKEAADLMTRLNEEDAIGILEQMEVDSAAELLQKMPRDKAASITRKMLVSSP